MALLVGPYNPITPQNGVSETIEIQGSLEGSILADINHDGKPVEIPALRLFGRRLDQWSSVSYWDVTPSKLRAMLEGLLRSGTLIGKAVSIHSVGHGPQRRDTLSVGPIV